MRREIFNIFKKLRQKVTTHLWYNHRLVAPPGLQKQMRHVHVTLADGVGQGEVPLDGSLLYNTIPPAQQSLVTFVLDLQETV